MSTVKDKAAEIAQPQKNGEAVKVATQKTVGEKEPPILPTKPTPANGSDPEQFKESIQPPAPISERLERLEFLNELNRQREEVTEAIEKLQRFEQSPHGGQSIIFRGANGDSTATQHPLVIEAMVQVANARLRAKLLEIEMQILL